MKGVRRRKTVRRRNAETGVKGEGDVNNSIMKVDW